MFSLACLKLTARDGAIQPELPTRKHSTDPRGGALIAGVILHGPTLACLGPLTPCHPPTMSIKSDRWIRRMAREAGMIEPFTDGQVRAGAISYGVSSYGYDMRVAPEFKIFTNALSAIVDPKNFDDKSFVEFSGDICVVPPNSFALARSVEYFRIPRNVLTICVGKSTYARCGIITNVTPFEPEWEGHVTLEISNTTPLPAKDLRERRHLPGAVLRGG